MTHHALILHRRFKSSKFCPSFFFSESYITLQHAKVVLDAYSGVVQLFRPMPTTTDNGGTNFKF
jgi:hypothetical protein